jgi:hypothetical protein
LQLRHHALPTDPGRQKLLFVMWRITKIVLASLTVLLGTVHVLCAFPISELDTDTLWFIGSGIAIIFAGFINLIAVYSPQLIARIIGLFTNVLLVGLFALASMVMEGIQVWVGMALFLLQGLLMVSKTKNQPISA